MPLIVAALLGLVQGVFMFVPVSSAAGCATLAARYSFYVAIPTILAATGVHALRVGTDVGFADVRWSAMLVGFAVAVVVGAGALWLVLRLLEQARFRIFSVYVWGLAAVVLVAGVGVGHG